MGAPSMALNEEYPHTFLRLTHKAVIDHSVLRQLPTPEQIEDHFPDGSEATQCQTISDTTC